MYACMLPDAESMASYQAQFSRKEGEESEVWISHNTHKYWRAKLDFNKTENKITREKNIK